jgi:hypothetical protein
MRRLAIIIFFSLSLTGAAWADGKGSGSQAAGSARAPIVYDFEDDQVEGDMQRPDGDLIEVAQKAGHVSLIEIRQDFMPELIKSFENM